MYDYFNKKLDDHIEEFGVERIRESVAELRALQKQISDVCVLEVSDKNGVKGTKLETWSNDVVIFKVR